MEIKQLEQEHLDAMESSDEQYSYWLPNAAKSSASITIEHMKGFAEWAAENEKEVLKLNHYTNFQPLWTKDNLSMNNTIKFSQYPNGVVIKPK